MSAGLPAPAKPQGLSQMSVSVAEKRTAAQTNRLVLSLRSRRVYLYQGDMLVSSYPVAVGASETPTPQGQFAVSKMVVDPVWQSPWTGEVHPPGPNSALGLRWIEFASTEAGAFGFHGTPTVESIGQAASNGCVRMYNDDVVALFAQVSVGTPVLVIP
ncbi:MAG: L,D-transpeptidase [Cyanobacteria bacterium J06623_4]